jgi:hypothetical protein
MRVKIPEEAIRAAREALLTPGTEVFVRVYGQDGRELFPESRPVRIPRDFAETGRVPMGLRVKRFLRYVALWRTRDAGAGVRIDNVLSADGFIIATSMYDDTPACSDDVVCTVDELRFDCA